MCIDKQKQMRTGAAYHFNPLLVDGEGLKLRRRGRHFGLVRGGVLEGSRDPGSLVAMRVRMRVFVARTK
jgi:hypothetical protein